MSLIFRLRQAINLTRKLRKIQFEDFILQNKVRNEFFFNATSIYVAITGQCSDDGNIKFVAESLSRWIF